MNDDNLHDKDLRIAFAKWKGYPLGGIDEAGHYASDYLNQAYRAFAAGTKFAEKGASKNPWIKTKDYLPIAKSEQPLWVFDPEQKKIFPAQWDDVHRNFTSGSGWFEFHEVSMVMVMDLPELPGEGL